MARTGKAKRQGPGVALSGGRRGLHTGTDGGDDTRRALGAMTKPRALLQGCRVLFTLLGHFSSVTVNSFHPGTVPIPRSMGTPKQTPNTEHLKAHRSV